MNRSAKLVITMGLLLAMALTASGCLWSRGEGNQQPAPTPEETTLTSVGQMAPDFTLENLDGQNFRLADQRGRVVLINWFATWCPPCQQEMPHLQSRVWEVFSGPDFVMVSVAREEEPDIVSPFVQKYKVTWPFLVDPDRSAYARYAEAFIPRNHVVGRDGRILFQSEGFEEAEFQEMIRAIEEALAAP